VRELHSALVLGGDVVYLVVEAVEGARCFLREKARLGVFCKQEAAVNAPLGHSVYAINEPVLFFDLLQAAVLGISWFLLAPVAVVALCVV